MCHSYMGYTQLPPSDTRIKLRFQMCVSGTELEFNLLRESCRERLGCAIRYVQTAASRGMISSRSIALDFL